MIRMRSMGWFLLGLVALCSTAWAQEAPDALVKRVAEEVLAQIKADQERRTFVGPLAAPAF